MKKIAFALLSLGTIFFYYACNKGANGYTTSTCSDLPVSSDSPALIRFAAADSIPLLYKDTSGMYYYISDSGAGASPTLASQLTVSYVGTLMDGTIFDQSDSSTLSNYALGQLILGWQYGLPKIKEGGRILLLIPSALAYGCQGAGTAIPPYSPIYFSIKLLHVR